MNRENKITINKQAYDGYPSRRYIPPHIGNTLTRPFRLHWLNDINPLHRPQPIEQETRKPYREYEQYADDNQPDHQASLSLLTGGLGGSGWSGGLLCASVWLVGLVWLQGHFGWLDEDGFAWLWVAYPLDVAAWAVETFIALVTNFRVFRTPFGAVHHHRRTLLRRLSWRLTIRKLITLFTHITSIWSWATQTIIQANHHLTILACISIHAFGAYSWLITSSNALVGTYHCALVTWISWLAWFASVLVTWKTLVAIFHIAF